MPLVLTKYGTVFPILEYFQAFHDTYMYAYLKCRSLYRIGETFCRRLEIFPDRSCVTKKVHAGNGMYLVCEHDDLHSTSLRHRSGFGTDR